MELDTIITEELKKEGLSREIIRAINQIRKEKGLTREKLVTVEYETNDEDLKKVFIEFEKEIKNAVLAEMIKVGVGELVVEINDKQLKLKVF